MKNKLVLLFTLILGVIMVSSCGNPNMHREESTVTYDTQERHIELYRFDGCQYIGHLYGSETDWCTHKGDCDNPKHTITTVRDSIIYVRDTTFLKSTYITKYVCTHGDTTSRKN